MDALAEIMIIEKQRLKRRKLSTATPAISPNTRYLRYRHLVQFRCIRSGIALPPGESPDSYRDHLTYDHLFIFEHENGKVLDRHNKDTPRFIGCLQLADGTYVHPQDSDFQRIYSKRTDVTCAWDVCGQEPYWVDTHALRMTRRCAKNSKKK